MLSVIIYTYDRIADARVNVEIITQLYPKESRFGGVEIIHVYNGKDEFNYTPELEDVFIHRKNKGHFKGAVDLINSGIVHLNLSSFGMADSKKAVASKPSHARQEPKDHYVLVLAADTWCFKPMFIANIIEKMKAEGKPFACSAWGMKKQNELFKAGFSLDFFILDLKWNKEAKLFPFDYENYLERFQDIWFALSGGGQIVPERALSYFWLKYWNKEFQDNGLRQHVEEKLYRITEREPIHRKGWNRRHSFPSIGLFTMHEVGEKKKILRRMKKKFGLRGKYIEDYLS